MTPERLAEIRQYCDTYPANWTTIEELLREAETLAKLRQPLVVWAKSDCMQEPEYDRAVDRLIESIPKEWLEEKTYEQQKSIARDIIAKVCTKNPRWNSDLRADNEEALAALDREFEARDTRIAELLDLQAKLRPLAAWLCWRHEKHRGPSPAVFAIRDLLDVRAIDSCFICGKLKGQPPDRCNGHYSERPYERI